MPEISRFLGIVIRMFFNEHNPPHFHAYYGNYEGVFCINTLNLIEGKMPPRVQGLILEWALLHQDELMNNWIMLEKDKKFNKIKPLV